MRAHPVRTVVAPFLLVALACESRPPASGGHAPEAAWPDSALLALTYPAPVLPAGRVTLSAGAWEGDSLAWGRQSAHIVLTARGDVAGRGQRDAAVVLFTDPGATGRFFDLIPVLGGHPGPRAGAATSLGDRVRPESVWVTGDRVHLKLVAHDTADGLCCPTRREERRYRLMGDSLALERADLIERLPPDPGGE
jgi:hypothetical protein